MSPSLSGSSASSALSGGANGSDNTLARTSIGQSYAAIDLGSNSFHMVIAEPEGNSIRIVDSLRSAVRLGAGLDKRKCIKPETQTLALETLGQFAQRLRGIPSKQMRIVGTNTLRRARNADEFMREAYAILGKRIEIISGREEARLIYSAVAHTLPDSDKQRLVIDIGGGSTELIIGQGYSHSLVESINMGCVSYSTRFLKADKLSSADIKRAVTEAQLELQPISKAYRDTGWDEVIGCSGTIKATARMLAELGITDGAITRDGLNKLTKLISEAGKIEKLNLQSISRDRAVVITGGIAVLRAILKELKIEVMQASQVALREGLIFDMIGKAEHIDIQSQTLANLITRYSIDTQQAERVENTVRDLFQHVAESWGLETEPDLDLLVWAAKLHELGMGVAHTQYHKHGAYILENSDLLGFSLAEQKALALLVRFHRRKIELPAFDGLPKPERKRLLKLLSLLRLAALLHRGRHSHDLDEIKVRIKEGQLTIVIPQAWQEEHPLTSAELAAEAERLLHIDIRLKTSDSA